MELDYSKADQWTEEEWKEHFRRVNESTDRKIAEIEAEEERVLKMLWEVAINRPRKRRSKKAV